MTRKTKQDAPGAVPETPAEVVTVAEMRSVALAALVRVAGDEAAPAAAQAQAARSLLEVVGMLGPRAVPDRETRPVSEMTAAEIDAELRALGG